MAFHYVEDFPGVVTRIYQMLSDGGYFVFSQENPLCTCHSGGNRWTKDENGNKIYLNLSNYGVEGERDSVWFVAAVFAWISFFEQVFQFFRQVVKTDDQFSFASFVSIHCHFTCEYSL